VELVLDQEQFLPSESVPVAVRITNRSGQPLRLGADADWLTFSVESADGFIVVKNSEVPVLARLTRLVAGRHQARGLAAVFPAQAQGRYRIIATLRIKDWSVQLPSPPKISP